MYCKNKVFGNRYIGFHFRYLQRIIASEFCVFDVGANIKMVLFAFSYKYFDNRLKMPYFVYICGKT